VIVTGKGQLTPACSEQTERLSEVDKEIKGTVELSQDEVEDMGSQENVGVRPGVPKVIHLSTNKKESSIHSSILHQQK
jgi:hypothetical protein